MARFYKKALLYFLKDWSKEVFIEDKPIYYILTKAHYGGKWSYEQLIDMKKNQCCTIEEAQKRVTDEILDKQAW